ncbi:protein of unassigned function [Methylobacterium oryzae CBMB20]|uniref:Protein of unassigned function n=2 Tax=Methylobacterium oryzae TaxID=334852 RepID=A0A089P0H9_9HYPH|nr:protein of unassigned function [Methylobacterium oryzae CBMB20]
MMNQRYKCKSLVWAGASVPIVYSQIEEEQSDNYGIIRISLLGDVVVRNKIEFFALLSIVLPCFTAEASCLEDARNFSIAMCDKILKSEFASSDNNSAYLREKNINQSIKELLGEKYLSDDGKVFSNYQSIVKFEVSTPDIDISSCRQRIFSRISDFQCKKKAVISTCARPEFGLNRWDREEVVSGNSGWRGGGHSQSEWCNDLAAQFMRQHGIGTEHVVSQLTTGENRRKKTFGHVDYSYSCSVKIKWDPIYNTKTDLLCGFSAIE